MPSGGWRMRWREGQARAQAANRADLARRLEDPDAEQEAPAANLAELGRRLEGPGAEQRLERVRSQFQQALAPNRAKPSGLAVPFVLVFLAVVVLGLILTG